MEKCRVQRSFLLVVTLFAIRASVAGEINGISAGSPFDYQTTGLLTVDSITATTGGGDYQTMKDGAYTISAPATTLDISSNTLYNKALSINGSSSSLTVTAGDVAALKTEGLRINSGTVSAEGGSQTNAYGVFSTSHVTVYADGRLKATGGSGTGASGVYANTLTVNGTVIAEGGTSATAHGINSVTSVAINADSSLEAKGGSEGAGLYTKTLTVTGSATAEGGASATAYGIHATTSVTVADNGSLVAKSGDGGAGLYTNSLTVNGKLTVQRGGSGAAVQVGTSSSHTLTFGSSSLLTVDLDGIGGAPFIVAKKADIKNGAEVEFVNTASIGMGKVSYAFLTTEANSLTGEFTLSNLANIDVEIEKRDSDSYWVTFNRHTKLSAQLAGRYGPNTTSLIEGLDALLGDTNPANADLRADLSMLESLASTDAGAAAEQADYMLKKYAPVDATRLQSTLMNLNTANLGQFQRNLFSSASESGAAAAVSSSDSLASLSLTCGTVRSFWLSPVAQWTRTKALTNEFVKGRENTYGAGMGFGVSQEGNYAAAIGLYYLNSNFNSHAADIDSDVYGINLYGRKYLPSSCRADLFLEGGAGFGYSDSDHTRKDLGVTSSPGTRIYNVNLAFGADFHLGRAVVTPKIGLDYNHLGTGSYTERGTGGLRVKSDNMDSLRGLLGVSVKGHLSDCLYLTANAAYRYEFADRNAVMTSRFVTAPDVKFVTEGEKRNRSSGEIGAGVGWQPRDNLRLAMNYDLSIAEKQLGHTVSARLALDF